MIILFGRLIRRWQRCLLPSPSPRDLRRIYDWMDVFGIAQNAIPS